MITMHSPTLLGNQYSLNTKKKNQTSVSSRWKCSCYPTITSKQWTTELTNFIFTLFEWSYYSKVHLTWYEKFRFKEKSGCRWTQEAQSSQKDPTAET